MKLTDTVLKYEHKAPNETRTTSCLHMVLQRSGCWWWWWVASRSLLVTVVGCSAPSQQQRHPAGNSARAATVPIMFWITHMQAASQEAISLLRTNQTSNTIETYMWQSRGPEPQSWQGYKCLFSPRTPPLIESLAIDISLAPSYAQFYARISLSILQFVAVWIGLLVSSFQGGNWFWSWQKRFSRCRVDGKSHSGRLRHPGK